MTINAIDFIAVFKSPTHTKFYNNAIMPHRHPLNFCKNYPPIPFITVAQYEWFSEPLLFSELRKCSGNPDLSKVNSAFGRNYQGNATLSPVYIPRFNGNVFINL